jgi:hypothetical protein
VGRNPANNGTSGEIFKRLPMARALPRTAVVYSTMKAMLNVKWSAAPFL